jgi:hypothetical protein
MKLRVVDAADLPRLKTDADDRPYPARRRRRFGLVLERRIAQRG